MTGKRDELAGALSQRLVWQTAADIGDGGGGAVRQWHDQAVLWARVAPLPVTATAHGHGHGQTERFAVTLRWRAGLCPGQRLIWRGRVLNIETSHDPDGRRHRLALLCRAET
ncbi:MAG: hypothetical protein Tsb0016_25110 [Sphingomonadales bacterium]